MGEFYSCRQLRCKETAASVASTCLLYNMLQHLGVEHDRSLASLGGQSVSTLPVAELYG